MGREPEEPKTAEEQSGDAEVDRGAGAQRQEPEAGAGPDDDVTIQEAKPSR